MLICFTISTVPWQFHTREEMAEHQCSLPIVTLDDNCVISYLQMSASHVYHLSTKRSSSLDNPTTWDVNAVGAYNQMFYWDDHTGLINFLYFTLFITQASDFINSCYNKSKYPILTNIRYRVHVFIFIMAKMPNNIRYRVFCFCYDKNLKRQVPVVYYFLLYTLVNCKA